MTQEKSQTKPHVLVVDDNFDSAETLAILIEMEGFTAATAPSLRAAREELLRKTPRLVFLDLTLPDGSGLDLLTQTADMPDTEVVVLSGSSDPLAAAEAVRRGAAAWLVKPADMQSLQVILDRATKE